MPVAQGRGARVAQPDGPLTAAVDEHVTLVRVELGCGDHLRQLFHVGRLDVHNVWRRTVKAERSVGFKSTSKQQAR